MAMYTRYRHLGEMQLTEQDDRASVMSHISDMLDRPRPYVTTLRSACMVLIAPVSASHASGMVYYRTSGCLQGCYTIVVDFCDRYHCPVRDTSSVDGRTSYVFLAPSGAIPLPQHHIHHHHQYEAQSETDGGEVSVGAFGGFGDELFDHHVHHGTGGESQQIRKGDTQY